MGRKPNVAPTPAGIDSAQGAGVGSIYGAQSVVGAGGGAVDGDAYPLNSCFLQTSRDGRGEEGAVHRHDHAVTEAGAMGRQVKDIGPKQGFAAGEDHHHLAHGGQIIQELEPLVRGELTGIRPGTRGSPAMEAGLVAAPGGFPGQEAEGGRTRWVGNDTVFHSSFNILAFFRCGCHPFNWGMSIRKDV